MRYNYLAGQTRGQIEAVLGRKIAKAEEASIESLAAFSDHEIEEFRHVRRGLNTVYAIVFIMHKLKKRTPLRDVQQFCEAVLVRGEPHAQWPCEATTEP